jgi:hypothetical protein
VEFLTYDYLNFEIIAQHHVDVTVNLSQFVSYHMTNRSQHPRYYIASLKAFADVYIFIFCPLLYYWLEFIRCGNMITKLSLSDRAHEGVDLRKSGKSRSVRQSKSGYSSRYEDSSESSYSSSTKTSRTSRRYTEETIEDSSYSSRRSDRSERKSEFASQIRVECTHDS